MLAVGLTAAGIVIATALTLRALQDNMMFFISVSEVVAGEYPEERTFRVGGLVVHESLEIDGLEDGHAVVGGGHLLDADDCALLGHGPGLLAAGQIPR